MEAVKRWKAGWGYPTTLLCIYGFLSTIKPLEPFLIPYLTGPDKNLTTQQVNNQILPVWTYSYLLVLVPVFLLTDWLRYKPVVMLQCVSLAVTTAMLLWLRGVAAMQAMQFFYGVVTASEVAYFSYIYSVVEVDKYRKATSYCRSVQLLGYTVGSVIGQLMVSFNLMSYHRILVFTLVLTAMALLTSCLLPMPQKSMFFHRKPPPVVEEVPGKCVDGRDGGATEEINNPNVSWEETGGGPCERAVGGREGQVNRGAQGCGRVLLQLGRDFRQCYTSRQLLYWSLWWALATCGYNQTVNYVQLLWEHVQPYQNVTIYNGGVEAVSNLFGATTAYGIGFMQVNWAQWGELTLGGFSGLGAATLFLMTFTGNIWACYTGYVIFKCVYMLLITIAMFQIAADLSMERYALIFGANNFGALVLQTIITSVVVDSGGLGLAIIPQFIIYASYFTVIAIVFSLRGVFTIWKVRKNHKKTTSDKKNLCSPDYLESKF